MNQDLFYQAPASRTGTSQQPQRLQAVPSPPSWRHHQAAQAALSSATYSQTVGEGSPERHRVAQGGPAMCFDPL